MNIASIKIPSTWTRAKNLRGAGISYSALLQAAKEGGILERKEGKVNKRKAVFYRSKTKDMFPIKNSRQE